MSYHAWQEHFGLDPAVIGATFTINQVAYTVVGIAPPGFFGDTLRSDPPDFWGSPIEGARSLGPHNNEPVASSRARMALSDGAAQARNQSRADSVAANGWVTTMAERRSRRDPRSRPGRDRQTTHPIDACGRWCRQDADGLCCGPALTDDCRRPGAADRLRQHRQPVPGARRGEPA